ncbi:MAG: hypothetical protein QF371_08600, partial [Flavobacteriales bacterium]|nr:hypothetical protein [Flavobacteriales bacterium]
LDYHELAAVAKIENGQLILEAYNASSSEVIELSQELLEGDFEVELKMLSMSWDSLNIPQFRMEVYDLENPQSHVSGIAVNNNSFYTYVDAINGNADLRIISQHAGVIGIRRIDSVLTSSAQFGNVQWSLADTLDNSDLGIRLVFGTIGSAQGRVRVVLDDLELNVSGHSTVQPDDFDCVSWF